MDDVVERDDLDTFAKRLRDELLRFDPLQVVVNLYSYSRSKHEESGAYDFPYVEYAALICWSVPRPPTTELLAAETIPNLHRDIGQLFHKLDRLYHEEVFLNDQARDIDELTLRIRHASLYIRNPAAMQHHQALFDGLLLPFETELRDVLGFGANDALACFLAIPDVHNEGRARLRAFVTRAKSEGQDPGFLQNFGEFFTVDAPSLARATGLGERIVESVLRSFSLAFGEAGEHVLFPSPFSALRERPLLGLGDGRYIVANPSLLAPSVLLRIEELLKDCEQTGHAARLWTRYERHRGRWVEAETARLIKLMLPGGSGCEGAYYQVAGDQVESDVVYQVDDLVVVGEAKAGAITPPSFRGAPGSLARDVREIIQKAHDQSKRAEKYILDGNTIFTDAEGHERFSVSKNVREILRIGVTLAPSDALATATSILSRAGFMSGEPTWILSLTDLMVLSECLTLPGELRHYSRVRYDLMADQRLQVLDETDFLGVYIHANGMPSSDLFGADVVWFDYSTEISNYYTPGKSGAVPHQKMAPQLCDLIRALARHGNRNWTHAVCDIFAFSSKSRHELGKQLSATVRRTRDGIPHDFGISGKEFGRLSVVAYPGIPPATLQRAFMEQVAENEPVRGKRLVIAYDHESGRANAEYYEGTSDRYYFAPPSLTWSSKIRRN